MITEHQRRIEQSRATKKANRERKAKELSDRGGAKIQKFIEGAAK